MGTTPKVQFGLSNVHYALITEGTGGAVTFGTPKKIPGSIALDLSAKGETTKTYADNVCYVQTTTNDGYDGDLEIAMVTDDMLQDIWGFSLGTTSKVLTENSGVEPKPFALLGQLDNDVNNTLIAFYYCTASRPNITGKTIEEGKKVPVTDKISLTITPLADGRVRAKTTPDTPTSVRNGWFSSVFEETAAAAQ